MKKHLSYLLVASALCIASAPQTTFGQSLQDKIAIAEVQNKPININIASSEELQRLPGIGAKKALAIVEFRDIHGEFTSLDDLTKVKGIGAKMLAKLADRAVVN